MENIFENAKFGDKFKTRDGRLAIYNYSPSCLIRGEKYHDIIIEGEGMSYHFLDKNNGMINTQEKEDVDYTTCIDIVSRWEE